MLLTPSEIYQLTGKKRRPAQVKVLRFMGIEHRVRPDASLIISRDHVRKLLDGDSVNMRFSKRIEPNWSAMDAKTSKGR
ncbi:hypothetical protein A4D02_35415 [Niastella koreensis]|uniref:DUF4224 domain-containing protein n=2 Tax=Niastella koreensis TaxID=354356 RepID=G8TJH0_NIAKG|nr:DUF4224 domain-containing protein [Niastella koreensis]AEV99705.1 hypothetical protein Niako_3399 [Niastella koreensis GR20-10]OQP44270.1 hypothetical protein A4D02_35415 [Niastella koreensis]